MFFRWLPNYDPKNRCQKRFQLWVKPVVGWLVKRSSSQLGEKCVVQIGDETSKTHRQKRDCQISSQKTSGSPQSTKGWRGKVRQVFDEGLFWWKNLHPGKWMAGTWKSPVWKGKSSEPNLHCFGFHVNLFLETDSWKSDVNLGNSRYLLDAFKCGCFECSNGSSRNHGSKASCSKCWVFKDFNQQSKHPADWIYSSPPEWSTAQKAFSLACSWYTSWPIGKKRCSSMFICMAVLQTKDTSKLDTHQIMINCCSSVNHYFG